MPGVRTVKTYLPQPDWLRQMTNGIDKGYTFRLLIDGENFAVVQSPGGNYLSGQTVQYGCTTYDLVDKRGDPRGGVGILRCSQELKKGGRIGSRILARWKSLVGASDKADRFVMEDYVVGRTDGGSLGSSRSSPDKIYFPTLMAAEAWLADYILDRPDAQRGDYYIDGPEG